MTRGSCLVIALAVSAPCAGTAQVRTSPLTLGIGSIVNTALMTTESFDVLAYFADHPIEVGGARATVRFVDHPREATWSLTGVVDGSLRVVIWRNGDRLGEQVIECQVRRNGERVPIAGEAIPGSCLRDLHATVRAVMQGRPSGSGGSP